METLNSAPEVRRRSERQAQKVQEYEDGEGSSRSTQSYEFECDTCDFTTRFRSALTTHIRQMHSENVAGPPRKKNRARVEVEEVEVKQEQNSSFEVQGTSEQHTTTTELIGRKRKQRLNVEKPDEPALQSNPEIRRLHDLGIVNENTTVGDFVSSQRKGTFDVSPEIDDEDVYMHVAREIEINDSESLANGESGMIGLERKPNYLFDEEVGVKEIDDEIDEINNELLKDQHFLRRNTNKNYDQRNNELLKDQQFLMRRRAKQDVPDRLKTGISDGKYQCYIKECPWRGNYRSLRMEHMRGVHPDWEIPSRYLLQRITKEGKYIDPKEHIPKFPCNVPGCDWRGNFRASRSHHMRSVHPDYHAETKRKSEMGSYNPNGAYYCHLADCDWRGSSRSTRSTHMKKAHPEWKSDDMKKPAILHCFACNMNMTNYTVFCHHIHDTHGLGMAINECFETKELFENWLSTIEVVYCVHFERRVSSRQFPDVDRFNLVCSCNSDQGLNLANTARSSAYACSNFLKRRNNQVITRKHIDCSVNLDVREDHKDGKVYVTGSLEHTGHRYGTPLLRMGPLERQFFVEYVDYKNIHSTAMPMSTVIEELSEIEGFRIDNYEPSESIELPEPPAEQPLQGLLKIMEDDNNEGGVSFFKTDLKNLVERNQVSVGYMSEDMRKTWNEQGAGRLAIIEMATYEIGNMNLVVFYVLVLDNTVLPKCCCVYMTTDQTLGYDAVLEELRKTNSTPPEIIITDLSECWVDAVERVFPQQNVSVAISEWSLLELWGTKADQMIRNDIDRFVVLSALRRILKLSDLPHFFYSIVEMFEAFQETNDTEFAQFFDDQLCDLDYFKRWCPLIRNPLTVHSHPTLTLCARYFRERYLDPMDVDRIDQYLLLMLKRIEEFNNVPYTETYTLRELDAPRKVNYMTMNTPLFAKPEEPMTEIVLNDGEYPGVEMYDMQGDMQLYDDGVVMMDDHHIMADGMMDQVVMNHELLDDEQIMYGEEELIEMDGNGPNVGREMIIEGNYIDEEMVDVPGPSNSHIIIQQDIVDDELDDEEIDVGDMEDSHVLMPNPRLKRVPSNAGARRSNKLRVDVGERNLSPESVRRIASRLIGTDKRVRQPPARISYHDQPSEERPAPSRQPPHRLPRHRQPQHLQAENQLHGQPIYQQHHIPEVVAEEYVVEEEVIDEEGELEEVIVEDDGVVYDHDEEYHMIEEGEEVVDEHGQNWR